jgi:hypothetical protein
MISAFIAGFKLKEQQIEKLVYTPITMEKTFNSKEVLLDSAVMRIQASYLEEDSVASVYLINQLELRPKTGKLMLDNLRRHHILDQDSYTVAVKKMESFRAMGISL